ncbi:GNAT family N-acetyltransferase [Paenibacillus sp. HJL G12]|uniref:GNAT family N-acetyltransferase n=1 Tax=Paenibacillus dendrobii TaxID=2691084 RepID=A0A7X3LID7_9BACL|nr:GNAT family N-acetyltransferase [Paenibacillus dendrobii]MWV46881.1 GNAT family N-acetyltransferase [Paenibacillus dendrobii]
MFAEKFRFPPVLRGERVRLEQIEKKDAPCLLAILSDPLVMKYVTQGSFFSFTKSRRVAAELLNTRRPDSMHYGIWLPEVEGPVGVVSLQNWRQERRDAMIGYMLDRRFWHRGLATEALGILLRYAFNELHLQRVEGRCHAVNEASERVMQKNGMELERTLNQKRMFFAAPLEMKIYSLTDQQFQARNTAGSEHVGKD